jgi:predicted MFS family arabinose efflux permease
VIVLVAARALQGVAAAAIYTTSLALLAQGFQGVARARAIAIWGATVAAAFGAGPVVGGLLTDAWNWRAIFFVNLALTLAAIPLAISHLSESADEAAPHADRPGFGLLTGGLFLGVFALIRGDALGWTSPTLLGIAAAALALLAAFAAVERIERWPMLDLHLFRNHTFVGASAIGFLQPAAAFAMFFFVTLFLLNVRGDSPPVAGLEVLPYAVVSLAVSVVAGRVSSRLPTRIVLVVGLLFCGAGLLLFHGLDASGSWTQLVPGLVVLGAGTGLVNPALTFAALGVVPRSRSGMASGVNNTFRQLGVAAGVAAFGAVLETRVRDHVDGALAATRGVGVHVHEVARLLAGHREDAALRLVPPGARHAVSAAYGSAFAAAVGDIALVAAVLTFAAAALAAVLVRKRDFAVEPQPAPVAAAAPAAARSPAT